MAALAVWARNREQVGDMSCLVSVHFPKAGGTSLARAYEEAFGVDQVLWDYDNDPADPTTRVNLHPSRDAMLRPSTLAPYRAVHGHFHPNFYTNVTDAVWVVALRHPVDNLLSIYFYWKMFTDEELMINPLHRYVHNEISDIVTFATIPRMRYLMTEVYFKGVDMARFDVIGDASDLDGYAARVGKAAGFSIDALPRENETALSEHRREIVDNPRIQRQLRDLLADDLRFYERHARR